MQEYTSKIVQINRRAEEVFAFFSDFTRLSQMVPRDKVDDFQSSADECTFTVKGVGLGLKILDRTPFTMIKYMGIGQVPFEFLFWVQLKQISAYDIRMRLVLHAKLNMVMKMMLKGKLQSGLDNAADQIAAAFNGTMPPPTEYPQN